MTHKLFVEPYPGFPSVGRFEYQMEHSTSKLTNDGESGKIGRSQQRWGIPCIANQLGLVESLDWGRDFVCSAYTV